MFTLEVRVGPSFWDPTSFVGEVMVSGKYYKAKVDICDVE